MRKLTFLSLALFALASLTACGEPRVVVSEVIFDGYGYYGHEVAASSYSGTYIEFGIGSGDFYEVAPESLQISFDEFSSIAAGFKNCNTFEAEPLWYEFAVGFNFYYSERRLCPPSTVGFPEYVFLDDVFEIETYFEMGRQVVVLYSEYQDVAIYLERLPLF